MGAGLAESVTPVGGATVRIRILVGGNHPIFRSGLGLMLGELSPTFTIVGEVAEAGAVADAARRRSADVVVYDEDSLGSAAVLASVAQLAPQRSARAVVLLGLGAGDSWREHLRAGARGLLFRDGGADELGFAVRSVAEGGVYLTPRLAGVIVRPLVRSGRPAGPAGRGDPLTLRQAEILDLMLTGVSNAEIAAELSLSEKTVKFHVSNILGKLNLKNRTQVLAHLMGGQRSAAGAGPEKG
ncbi:response regulator transcription factor [Micromonospora sp. NPDC023956]|uniref:response regulator transcription factor n=1 Tax=Micromonospora sp. NPDC023956 TaxID=3155722 RepID=UPI0033F5512C